jgi:outer membrane cobalamin receptor
MKIMNRITAVVFGLCCSVLCSYTASADEPGVKLKEVVVTATRTEKEPQDVTQSVTVITADEIRKSGAKTAEEVIERTTSVDLHDTGPKGSKTEFSLRGSTAQQVLVLLDGRRMNSVAVGGFDFSTLPVSVDAIERIEILRGPSSVLYGADAVGGVINIITKKPTGQESTVTSAGGSHGYWTLGASNAAKVGNYYYSLSANRERSDGYRINSDLDKTVAGGKIGYEVSNDSSLEFTADYLEKEIGVPGSTQFTSPLARQWDRNAASSLMYRTKVSKELDLRVTGYYNRNKLLFSDPNLAPFDPTFSRHITSSTGAEVQTNWFTAPSAFLTNVLTVGAETKADHLESSDAGGHSAALQAFYVQDEISIGEPFIFVLGGRYDNHSVYGENVSPRASARYRFITTGTILRISGGEAFRAPTFDELYWPKTTFTAGNRDLKPEFSREFEGGVEQSIGKGSSVKFTLFERHVKDLIVWMPNSSFVWSPTNFGSARISGYETEAKTTFFDMLVWGVNYTAMNTSNQDTGEPIIGAPAEQFKSYLNLTVPNVKTNVYLEGRYMRNYWIPSVGASNPSSHYGVADVKISQPVAFGSSLKTDVFVAVKNITNRSYEVSGGYPMPPTEVFGGLTLRF